MVFPTRVGVVLEWLLNQFYRFGFPYASGGVSQIEGLSIY